MLENIVPILYYSPTTIEQITAGSKGEQAVSGRKTKKSTLGLALKTILEKMWLLVGGEIKGEYGYSNENTIDIEYNNLSRAVATVKKIQEENRLLLKGGTPEADSLLHTFTLLQGDFKVKLTNSMINNSYLVEVEHESDGIRIHGTTSLENWISSSLINQLLVAGKFAASAIVYPLSVDKNTIEAKFACIFIMRD